MWKKKPTKPVEKNLTIEFDVTDSDVERARKLLILSGMVLNATAETMALNMSEGISIYRKLDLNYFNESSLPTPVVEESLITTKDTTKTKTKTKQKEI